MSISFPHFDPPYDSPIQHGLAWVLAKYVADGVRFIKEKEVATHISGFRVDLVLEIPGQTSIGIECDGREYHDPLADLFRDALILGSSGISAIYRFPGRVLSSRPEDALFLLSHWQPEFFNERIAVQRDLLASDDVRKAMNCESAWDDLYPYLFEWHYRGEEGQVSPVEVIRHRFGLRNPPPDSLDRIWAFSKSGTYHSVEALAHAFAAQHPTREWRGWGYYCTRASRLFSTLDAKHFTDEKPAF